MEHQNEINRRIFPSTLKLIIIVVCVIIILFLAVYSFTRNSFIDAFNLSDKGTIGDAINGITGPIIAIMSAGLLYYSFQAQLEANKRQLEANKSFRSQWEFDTYYKLFGEIEKAFMEDLVLKTSRRKQGLSDGAGIITEEHRAVGYLLYVKVRIPQAKDDEVSKYLSQIDPIIEDIIVLINYVRESDVSQKHFFLHRINRLYTNSLEENLNELYNLLKNKQQFQQSYQFNELLKQKIISMRENELKRNILS